jgi:hypothetical protein
MAHVMNNFTCWLVDDASMLGISFFFYPVIGEDDDEGCALLSAMPLVLTNILCPAWFCSGVPSYSIC